MAITIRNTPSARKNRAKRKGQCQNAAERIKQQNKPRKRVQNTDGQQPEEPFPRLFRKCLNRCDDASAQQGHADKGFDSERGHQREGYGAQPYTEHGDAEHNQPDRSRLPTGDLFHERGFRHGFIN